VQFRFTTVDPTVGTFVFDVVKVKVHSNGDHGQCDAAIFAFDQAAQDLSNVAVILPMDSQIDKYLDLHYTPVTADVEGCAGLVKTKLRIGDTPTDVTVDAQGVPSVSFIKVWDNTPEQRHVKLVLNQAMMDDLSSDLAAYSTGPGTWSVPMSFSHYKTPINVGDLPIEEKAFTVVFRSQTMAEKCDIATLAATTLVADQEYVVTKDNLAKTEITKTAAEPTLSTCVVTVKLQVIDS
jgi:hypothetical protein